ncbi:MAG: nucleotidyltransferase domain-containing protein [bacterium]
MENMTELKSKIAVLAEKHNLKLVVLFGSQARNRANKESDIDVGIYRDSNISWDEKIKLSLEFGNILKNNNVDVEIISSNSPLLMHNILNSGKILFEKDKDVFFVLKLYAWKVFTDSKMFRDNCFKIIKERSLNI